MFAITSHSSNTSNSEKNSVSNENYKIFLAFVQQGLHRSSILQVPLPSRLSVTFPTKSSLTQIPPLPQRMQQWRKLSPHRQNHNLTICHSTIRRPVEKFSVFFFCRIVKETAYADFMIN